MEMRGQLHAPAALPPGKEPLVPMKLGNDSRPKPFHTFQLHFYENQPSKAHKQIKNSRSHTKQNEYPTNVRSQSRSSFELLYTGP
jgi:hypothetical protein